MRRESGILLSVASLPSRYGIGCFSKEAYEFVDQLKAAGQSYWQILPLGPTSYGDSPYQSFSTFAGNPYYISLENLIDEGLLTREECEAADLGDDAGLVDYEKLYENRFPLLRKAYERSGAGNDPEFLRFKAENAWWLDDYALYMAVKARFDQAAWTQWAKDIRLRWQNALDYYRRELYFDIEFHQYLQYLFMSQWNRLKAYANSRGIRIVGDIPIYVALDSADAWASPELFQLDENNAPQAVAGCPPDGFSATGQLWGNPLYRWDYHRQTGYGWWIKRLSYCYRLYDVVRIDHFRGFDQYFSIPAGAENAVGGHWEQGPGIELFRRVKEALGDKEIIAEDLGYVTDSVRRLVAETGYPGMKVLEFAFDSRDSGCASDYLPHNYPENCVAYTGTHDNETIAGWFESIKPEEQKLARDYLCDHYTPVEELHLPFISLVMRSQARMCIIPLQDYLGLGNDCRINTPSTVGENWRWRLVPGQMSEAVTEEIGMVTRRYGRWNWD
ncbi:MULTISPECIES: 4-alpha-glucanotransferase [Enterocloster]|uniref:4-alpha-glucanotransferase n=1 Tax=Enterocloster lavalensis TaxID=460384 RepID=A0A1I0FGW1_9FIRM|nr:MULTISPECIES: 4-alpha-glucanotransferase [Enterocloster]MDR3755782.1 4-alpha-glucanotransferase [Enterocloster sp.]SET56769.1 4-alpha-glucanotransferase [Enterocloster lavalensis]